jgi:hypothetical protein
MNRLQSWDGLFTTGSCMDSVLVWVYTPLLAPQRNHYVNRAVPCAVPLQGSRLLLWFGKTPRTSQEVSGYLGPLPLNTHTSWLEILH